MRGFRRSIVAPTIAPPAPVEALESRVLFAGVTLITHGYEVNGNFPGWVDSMRTAIENRIGNAGTDTRGLRLSISDDAQSFTFSDLRGTGSFSVAPKAEAVIGVDWANASNNNVQPSLSPLVSTSLAAARIVQSLFALDSEVGNTGALVQMPIYLVGQGRGGSVMVEVARQLAAQGIWVAQLTLLDPHPLDSSDNIRSGGEDPAMALFSNVLFADNYFRTSNPSANNPAGQSVSTAFNNNLTSLIFTTDEIHAAYHGTIDLGAADDQDGTPIQNSWYGPTVLGPRAGVGFYLSRLASNVQTSAGLLAALGGAETRPLATTGGSQWPNVTHITVAPNASVSTGGSLAVPFVYGDRDSSPTLRFYYDTDTNPYNGWAAEAGSTTMPLAAMASTSFNITPGTAQTGVYYLGVEITDGAHTRYDYATNQVTVLAGFPFEAVYPEGFAADNINEFVPITNTQDVAVTFELVARYETGSRDQTIATGVIPAHTRGGVTICETRFPESTIVRKNEPYTLVLRSTLPLAATFSHYDFGTSIGEAFTYDRNTTWTFGDGLKDTTQSRDFILVYNPADTPVSVTIELYNDQGLTYTDTRVIGGQRRGGWSINDIAEQPLGRFGSRITATGQIVAAQSHYQPAQGRGYGALGNPGNGTLAGIVPSINFDENFYTKNGDGGQPHFSADSFISVLNPGNATATILLYYVVATDGPGGQAPIPRVLIAPPRSRSTMSIRDAGVPVNSQFGLVFRSNVAVTVTGSVYEGQDGTGVTAGTIADTEWVFGEGYMSRSRAGAQIIENLFLFNPGASDQDVTITFMFTDGTQASVVQHLDARELEYVHVHELAAIVNRAEDQWYGIKVTGTAAIVAGMEHWDGGIGGGFQTLGTHLNGGFDFSTVLTI